MKLLTLNCHSWQEENQAEKITYLAETIKEKSYDVVYEDFSGLSKSEQLALFNAMKQDLFPDEPDKITKLLKSIREARFASGLGCVHCGSTSVKRNGKISFKTTLFV